MAQNMSSAVMQQRSEPHDSLDDFPTPPWATRALLRHVIIPEWGSVNGDSCWEPASNRGYMVRPLNEYFRRVYASDIHDYSAEFGGQERVVDFLFPGSESPCIATQGVDWVITNPPFRLAQQFIARSSQIARVGFAVIVRSAYLEGVGRYQELFSKNPPSIIAQFTERVIMTKGILRDPSKLYWDEDAQKWKRPSTATAYCWLVWIDGEVDTRFLWIPPCRKQLEFPEDYQRERSTGQLMTGDETGASGGEAA